MITTVNVAMGFGAILLMLGTLRWRHHVRGDQDEMRGSPPKDGKADVTVAPPPIAADRDRV